MSRQLDRKVLATILQAEDIEGLSYSELVRLFREDTGISNFLPDGIYQIDPRTGDHIIYHSSRARRPHKYPPARPIASEMEQECVICEGHTTGVIDVADLSEGFTFINKNLFPILYSSDISYSGRLIGKKDQSLQSRTQFSFGLHLLQWTSSYHAKDWHNMPLSDCSVVMERLAALEKKLLGDSRESMRTTGSWEHGFVLIVKNHGSLVGGSLPHGHQQIALSNVMPRRIRDNWRFETERGELFSRYVLRENPADLMIKDYGPAVLLVPYFMRRPFDMMLLLKDEGKRYLYELTEAELEAVAGGWRDATRVMHLVLPEIGREIAYNITTSNGPGAGLYFEFLPYSQETGGFEHLGLHICQHKPSTAAVRLREFLRD